jgi:ribokinase
MTVKSQHLPGPGETVVGGEFFLAPGGKGANQAVAAARLGGDVVFATKVGDDTSGTEVVAGYKNEGIDVSQIVREHGKATGVALILVDSKGENIISVASGANHVWSDADIKRLEPVIAEAGIVVFQLEIPIETVLAAAKSANKLGVPILLDPAPACSLPDELYAAVSYLKPNEHEAETLTGIKVLDEPSAIEAAKVLLDKGVRECVIITLGSKGALVLKRNGEPKLIAAPKVNAMDTTAAGDAFTGALAYRITQGENLFDAVRFANNAGAISASRMGAQPSLPTLKEVELFLSSQ